MPPDSHEPWPKGSVVLLLAVFVFSVFMKTPSSLTTAGVLLASVAVLTVWVWRKRGFWRTLLACCATVSGLVLIGFFALDLETAFEGVYVSSHVRWPAWVAIPLGLNFGVWAYVASGGPPSPKPMLGYALLLLLASLAGIIMAFLAGPWGGSLFAASAPGAVIACLFLMFGSWGARRPRLAGALLAVTCAGAGMVVHRLCDPGQLLLPSWESHSIVTLPLGASAIYFFVGKEQPDPPPVEPSATG